MDSGDIQKHLDLARDLAGESKITLDNDQLAQRGDAICRAQLAQAHALLALCGIAHYINGNLISISRKLDIADAERLG